jgi:hypothetical protein
MYATSLKMNFHGLSLMGRVLFLCLPCLCVCSGIRDDGGRIVDRLLGMARDVLLLE